ncbi:DNA pilot protein [Flyfo microvirus Tbat2_103]|nr:DNA pilot protein [Flyfo microvirus Tbat2_103]
MNPLVGSALLGAGSGMLSSVFSGIGANKRQKKAIAAQKEENALARKWNEAMYDKSVANNRADVADMRAYNDPKAVMNRLKSAGLNPDLMYGGGAGSLVQAQVGNSASAPSYSPSDMGSLVNSAPSAGEIAGNAISQGLDNAIKMAQKDNIEAQTAKTKEDTAGQSLDNIVKDAQAGVATQLADLDVKLGKSVANLNEQQLENLKSSLNKINEEISNLKSERLLTEAKTSGQSIDNVRNRLQYMFDSKTFNDRAEIFRQNVNQLRAGTNLSLAQSKEILSTLASKVWMIENQGNKYFHEANNAYNQGSIISQMNRIVRAKAGKLELDLQRDSDWGDIKYWTDLVGDAAGTLSEAANTVLNFRTFGLNKAKTFGKTIEQFDDNNGYSSTKQRHLRR